MIPSIDWAVFLLGLLGGTLAGALFFAGLAWGVRVALRSARPVAVLLPSAAIRIGMLLLAGLWIAEQGGAALAGFITGFVVLRLVMLAVLRVRPVKGDAQWN